MEILKKEISTKLIGITAVSALGLLGGLWALRIFLSDSHRIIRNTVEDIYEKNWDKLYSELDVEDINKSGISRQDFPKFCESFFSVVPKSATRPKLIFTVVPPSAVGRGMFDPRNEQRVEIAFPSDVHRAMDVPSKFIARTNLDQKWLCDGFMLMFAVQRGYGPRSDRLRALKTAMQVTNLKDLRWPSADMGTTITRLDAELKKSEADMHILERYDVGK